MHSVGRLRWAIKEFFNKFISNVYYVAVSERVGKTASQATAFSRYFPSLLPRLMKTVFFIASKTNRFWMRSFRGVSTTHCLVRHPFALFMIFIFRAGNQINSTTNLHSGGLIFFFSFYRFLRYYSGAFLKCGRFDGCYFKRDDYLKAQLGTRTFFINFNRLNWAGKVSFMIDGIFVISVTLWRGITYTYFNRLCLQRN